MKTKGIYHFKNGNCFSQGGGWQINALGINRKEGALTRLRRVAGITQMTQNIQGQVEDS